MSNDFDSAINGYINDNEGSPARRVERIMHACVGSDLSSWEKFEFLPNVAKRNSLTPKQEEVLRQIEDRVL